jgi:hypothetical protein
LGVFVIGMHRSGTSAVADALGALGLTLGEPGEHMRADPANPGGFFELRRIGELNDEILAELGGRWDCPPALAEGWENRPAMTPLVRKAMTTKAALLPRERWVLKDPRITLLLPLWRRAVLDRCAAVLVVRHPMEVAWSVTLRNGIPTMTGLALWSAYNRAALYGLGGLPVYVCDYRTLLDAPLDTVADIARALADWGELDRDADLDLDAAAARIRPELRRNTWRRDSPDALDPPGEIDRLEKLLTEVAGRHDVFEPPAPPAAPWELALVSERRSNAEQLHMLTAQRSRLEAERAELTQRVSDAEAQVAELAQHVARSDASVRDIEARLQREERRAAQLAARWDRLERRFPVRVFRAVQRAGRRLRPR